MRNTKRVISMILAVCMLLSVLPLSAFAVDITSKPENGTTVGQPFLAGTGGSTNFRIPGIVTLDDGTLIAASDARWNGTADAGGLDTIVSVSTDNGENWTYTFANYLGDNGNTWYNQSSCIIDPAIGTDGTTAYLIADLFPAGFAINSAKYAAQRGSTGFDDAGHLLLRSDSDNGMVFGSDNYHTDAASAAYDYYLADGKIYKIEDGTEVDGSLSVDAYFNVTGTDADGNEVNTNLFFADSPYKPFPTDYLYMTTSTDGLTWSEPTLLNLKAADEQTLLVGPGNGTYNDVTGHMIFTAYEYDFGTQNTAVIWRDTDGQWYRSENVAPDNWTSEATSVVLDDGTVRVFYRDGFSVLRYTDMAWDEETHNYVCVEGATEVTTEAAKRSNNQLSAIRYSQQIDGKDVILVACASNADARSNGYLYVFLLNEDNTMELAYSYDIVPGTVEGYAYNCISEMEDGRIALLYEGDNAETSASAEIIFTTIDMADVTVTENDARLNFIDVDLHVGNTWTLKDTTGNYSEISEYDTTVVNVTAEGVTETVPAATGMASGTAYALTDALYTLTATDGGYYLHHTLSDGTEVYIDAHAGAGNGGYPNRAYTTVLSFEAGSADGTIWIKDSGGSLHLHKEAEPPYWNQCSSACGYKHDMLFFRPAVEGETESEIFTGFVQVTSVDDLADGGQYLIAAYDDAENLYILNPVLGGASSTSNDQLALVGAEAEVSTTTVTIEGLAVGTTQVQIGSNVYTITVTEMPAVEIEVRATESTSFTIEGAYYDDDVTGLDTTYATVTLEAVGDPVTYGELKDTDNSGTRVELADSEYTFTGSDSAYTISTVANGTTFYISGAAKGHTSSGAVSNTITWNDDGSVYIKDTSHYLYVNRSTLAWDRTGTVSGYEEHIIFYLYGAGEDADSAIPGYTLITADDQITSGEGYLIAFYDANGQLYVMNPTTRTTTAYNQMAAVVSGLENATTTVTITGVAEGTTSMELAGTEYNIIVRAEDYDPISIPATENVYQGAAVTITEKPANGTTQGQPFASGTGGSANFRIPGIVTLNDGTIIASTDARWNHSGDGAGLDTIVSVSTDNGANWTYTYANYLGDNGNVYNNLSTCFIDPAIGTDGETAYMIADLFPAGIALNTSMYAPVVGENGFDDNGNLLLRDLAGDTVVIGSSGYNTMAAEREYNYYLDLQTYTIHTANGTLCEGFTVDEYFNISYTDAEGTTHNTNLFFADSPFQPYPTDYLYLTTSEDGLNWSVPKLLNLQSEDEQTLLVGPGNGTYDATNDNMVFTAYRHTGGAAGTSYECTCLIWMDTEGNWHRSEDATTSGWSSEASAVVLSDGTVRVFYRDGYSVLRYTDYQWSADENNYVRDANATEVSTTAAKKSGCQLTSILYSQQIEGKEAIIVATPAYSGGRNDGHVYTFLVEEDNTMTLAYDYDITPDSNEYYAYSCITELQGGNLGLLWESGGAALTYTEIDATEMQDRENDARLNFVDVTVYTGESVTVTDTTGYHVGADTSELDPAIATVTMTGSEVITNAAQVLGTGSNIDLDDCQYTFTASGDYFVISNTLADGTTVYLNHYLTSSNSIPNITTAGDIAVLEGTVEGMFRLQAQVQDGGSGSARTLHFHAEAAAPYWNRCGSDTSYKCHEYLFRKAAEGETSSTDIPGYVQITSLDEVVDGGQYLIAAKNDAGNWYVLNPTTSTTALDHVAQIMGSTTIGTTYLTFTAVAEGYTEALIGTTVYHVTVKESIYQDITINEGETVTHTIEGDNYANVDISGLDTSIVTVTMDGQEGTNDLGVAVEYATALPNGTYVILNTRALELINNTTATSSGATGLALDGDVTAFDASTAVWTITAVDGGYTIQDTNGKYMTVASSSCALSDEVQVLTLSYGDGSWSIGQNSAYLNDFGGTGTAVAGYGSIDGGSLFRFYSYGEPNVEPSTTVTFTGVGAGTTTLDVERVHYNITVNHVHSYEAVVTEPTCTEGGYTTHTCACGDSYVTDETEALGHNFENGTCTVCGAGIAYNEDTEVSYTTLAEALAAAGDGDTVTLLADCAEERVVVIPGVTLDLNGHVLTADYTVAFNSADIVDNVGTGKLITGVNNLVLDQGNGMVPVYAGDGYIFTKVGFGIGQDESVTNGFKIKAVAYPVNTSVIDLLKDGCADNNIQIAIRLTWDTEDGTGSQEFVFSEDVVTDVYCSTTDGSWGSYSKMFTMTITGFANIQNLQADMVILSGTNSEYISTNGIEITE